MIPIAGALLLTLVCVGLDAALVRTDGGAALLTPDPARVVQSFVGALTARRADVAAERLTHGDDPNVKAELQTAADALRARHGFYRVTEAQTRRAGEVADVDARILSTRAGVLERRFRLARDPSTRLWKIIEFEPLT